MSIFTSHQSPVTSHQSPVTSHQSPVTSHQSLRFPSIAIGLVFLLIVPLLLLDARTMQAQPVLRDERGDPLPTPAWPPPDSIYEPMTISVWFNRSTINHQYLCDYWDGVGSEDMLTKLSGEPLDGCFDIDSTLITNPAVFNMLKALGAYRMCQYTTMSPCRDTLSFTRGGDTIRTPEFWNSFYIFLDSARAAEAVEVLNVAFAGTAIDFAELNGRVEHDTIPNDPRWTYQTHYLNILHGINMVDAWDIEKCDRSVKLAIVDDGFDYRHPDFGGGIGPGYPFVDGREYNTGRAHHLQRPPTNGGSHGTGVAGFIGAKTNNNLDVASIAGAWGTTMVPTGVSLYAMKCPYPIPTEQKFKDYADAWIEAAAHTSGDYGFAVNIISNSNGWPLFQEVRRRALDYAYRLGVSCFSSKGNDSVHKFRAPADYEYSKIVAVGAMAVGEKDKTLEPVPVRHGASNWGYGLDVMAPGTDQPGIHTNQTLADSLDGRGPRSMSYTSAATAQVAGVAALLLSEMNTGSHPNIDGPLAPEDVQGLLSVTALDMDFTVNSGSFDTTGYDARTGYGLIKADQALTAMMNPYELRHYSETGGTIDSTVEIYPFIVLAPTHGEPLLAPSVHPNYYVAYRHRVRKVVLLSGWEMARSWGRGGDSTVGWNGAQPTDADNNSPNYQTGYTRVVGDALPNEPAFNYGNIRDISHRNDQCTLETFIYEVYDGTTAEFIGWYPTTADSVVYRYTIWGEPTTSSVVSERADSERSAALVNLRCQVHTVVGRSRATLSFAMMQPGPVDITVYDALGRQVQSERREYWSSQAEQSFGFDVEELPSGIYFVVVRSGSAMGTCRMEVLR